MTTLHGDAVTLRLATTDDIAEMARIRATPEVHAWWRGDDLAKDVQADLDDPETEVLAIEHDGRLVGQIQWYAEADPDYRHAGMDIYLDPEVHGRGLGADAVRTLARHLIEDLGHHRLIIDPAAANAPAIACYAKVGFKPVGVMRRYERDLDGGWHDNLLMDLLAEELATGNRSAT